MLLQLANFLPHLGHGFNPSISAIVCQERIPGIEYESDFEVQRCVLRYAVLIAALIRCSNFTCNYNTAIERLVLVFLSFPITLWIQDPRMTYYLPIFILTLNQLRVHQWMVSIVSVWIYQSKSKISWSLGQHHLRLHHLLILVATL